VIWVYEMLDVYIAFITPWITLIAALYKLRDDPVWSIILSITGVMAGVAGVLVADVKWQQWMLECTVNNIIVCPQPQPFRTLGFTAFLALILNLAMVGFSLMMYAVETTRKRVEEIP